MSEPWINAIEARRLTQSAWDKRGFYELVTVVAQKIREAAGNGKSFVIDPIGGLGKSVDAELREAVYSYLRDKGFEVSVRRDSYIGSFTLGSVTTGPIGGAADPDMKVSW